jgi:hypothetical protein
MKLMSAVPVTGHRCGDPGDNASPVHAVALIASSPTDNDPPPSPTGEIARVIGTAHLARHDDDLRVSGGSIIVPARLAADGLRRGGIIVELRSAASWPPPDGARGRRASRLRLFRTLGRACACG